MPLTTLARACAALLAAAVMGLTGCASIPPGAGTNPADPWETYNRNMDAFNDRVDRAVLKPVARVYADYVPQGARDCVGNVFSNINDLPTALNNLFQGKLKDAGTDVCRFVINSTVGALGCFDVASSMGLDKRDEDFGQTLGRWGLEPGPYFVWPLLGPSTVRDSVGRVVGFYTDPLDQIDHVRTRNSFVAARVIDGRASLLQAEKLVDGASLDRYQFIRDAYLQRRRNLVHDGNPPRLQDPEELEEEDADADTAPPAPVTSGNEKAASEDGSDTPAAPAIR